MNKKLFYTSLLTMLTLIFTPEIHSIRLFKPAFDTAEEIDQLFDTFLEQVNKSNINNLDDLLNSTKPFFEKHADQIIECENELVRTYESWFKPWHWTKHNKLAHKQLNTLFSLLMSSTICPSDNYKKMSWLAKKTYGKDTDYPHLHLEERIYKYIKFIKKDKFFKQIGLPYEIKAELLKKLQRVYRNVFAHQEYINEKRAFRQQQQLNQLQNKLDELLKKDEKKEKDKDKEIKSIETTVVHYSK